MWALRLIGVSSGIVHLMHRAVIELRITDVAHAKAWAVLQKKPAKEASIASLG